MGGSFTSEDTILRGGAPLFTHQRAVLSEEQFWEESVETTFAQKCTIHHPTLSLDYFSYFLGGGLLFKDFKWMFKCSVQFFM